MKTPNTISVIILLLIMAGCGGRSNQSADSSGTVDVIANYAETEPTMQDTIEREENLLEANDTILNQSFVKEIIRENHDDIITVDVTKNYSSKKELILQDFMDVEYIALETNDDFLHQGVVMDIGKEIIVVKNRINDGDIFIYGRNGKALRKINHRGQGPGEYTGITTITLDEDNDEMFVNDINLRKIFVYNLDGLFKRSFNHQEGVGYTKIGTITVREHSFYSTIFNFNKNNLICYDKIDHRRTFIIISKQDGSITKEISIPFKDKISLNKEIIVDEKTMLSSGPGPYHTIIPYKGNWILSEVSSDTIYTSMPDYSLRPFIERTPSVQSSDPVTALFLRLVTEQYIFMETFRNDYNFTTETGLTYTWLMYDKQNKTFSDYVVYYSDFSIPTVVNIGGFIPINHEIAACYPLQAFRLVESYKKGELKDGRLKEIAVKLDPEDNPVIMIVKHKK